MVEGLKMEVVWEMLYKVSSQGILLCTLKRKSLNSSTYGDPHVFSKNWSDIINSFVQEIIFQRKES